MYKYIILTMCVALCACNNGGGHSGGGYSNTNIKPGNVSGGNQTVVPSTPEEPTPDVPEDTDKKPNGDIKYPNVHDSKQLSISSMGTFYTKDTNYVGPEYSLGGVFDKEKGELIIQRLRPYKYTYTSTCQDDSGCDLSYRYGEEYYRYIPYASGEQKWEKIRCGDNLKGCTTHADKDQEITIICRNLGGCLLENDSEPEIIFNVKNSDDGKFIKEFSYKEGSFNNVGQAEFVLGSKNLNIPLRFSDFGYWGRTTTGPKDSVAYTFQGWTAGDSERAVDMKTLADVGAIKGEHTYSGKAFVGISTGKTRKVNDDRVLLGDDMPGFVANGAATLSFNSDTGTENLVMDFTNVGWYKVYTKDNELIYVGNPLTDPKFKVESNKSNYTKDIQYYGPDAFLPATEAVGTVEATDIKMQDGFYRDIDFSFGAVKD